MFDRFVPKFLDEEKQQKEEMQEKRVSVEAKEAFSEISSREMDRIVEEVIRDFQSDIEYLKDK